MDYIFVKANFINQYFKKDKEYVNPSMENFLKAIEHKIYIPENQISNVRENKLMLCSFISFRVIGNNKLLWFETKEDEEYSVVRAFPVERRSLKTGESYAFEKTVVDVCKKICTNTVVMPKTHLQVNGAVRSGGMFGIHYTILIPEEFLSSFDFSENSALDISYLQTNKDTLDDISALCIDNYKEIKR